MIKECRELEPFRPDVKKEDVAKKLWEFSEKQIEQLEKEGAVKRALAKKEAEQKKKKESEASADTGTTAPAPAGKKEATPGSRRSRKAK